MERRGNQKRRLHKTRANGVSMFTIAGGIVLAVVILANIDVILIVGVYLILSVIAAGIFFWCGAPLEFAAPVGLFTPAIIIALGNQ